MWRWKLLEQKKKLILSYWFCCSWSLKSYRKIGNRNGFSFYFRYYRKWRRRQAVIWGGCLQVWNYCLGLGAYSGAYKIITTYSRKYGKVIQIMLKLCLGAQQKGTLILFTVLIWDYDVKLYLLRLVWEVSIWISVILNVQKTKVK